MNVDLKAPDASLFAWACEWICDPKIAGEDFPQMPWTPAALERFVYETNHAVWGFTLGNRWIGLGTVGGFNAYHGQCMIQVRMGPNAAAMTGGAVFELLRWCFDVLRVRNVTCYRGAPSRREAAMWNVIGFVPDKEYIPGAGWRGAWLCSMTESQFRDSKIARRFYGRHLQFERVDESCVPVLQGSDEQPA